MGGGAAALSAVVRGSDYRVRCLGRSRVVCPARTASILVQLSCGSELGRGPVAG